MGVCGIRGGGGTQKFESGRASPSFLNLGPGRNVEIMDRAEPFCDGVCGGSSRSPDRASCSVVVREFLPGPIDHRRFTSHRSQPAALIHAKLHASLKPAFKPIEYQRLRIGKMKANTKHKIRIPHPQPSPSTSQNPYPVPQVYPKHKPSLPPK